MHQIFVMHLAMKKSMNKKLSILLLAECPSFSDIVFMFINLPCKIPLFVSMKFKMHKFN